MFSRHLTPTNIKISAALREHVQILADSRDRSVHSLMPQALETFVEREEQREKIRQDALKTHEYYMFTGLHITNTDTTKSSAGITKCFIADITNI